MLTRFLSVFVMASLAFLSTTNAQTFSPPGEDATYSSQVASFDSGRSITLRGGWNWLGNIEDSSVIIGGGESSPFVRQSSDEAGYGVSVGLGKALNSRLRTETEFAFRSNNIRRGLGSFLRSELDADLTAFSLLQNVFVDFDNRTRFTPYAGAGIGISFVDMESNVTSFLTDGTIFEENELSDDDTAFTYQFIGGVSTAVTPCSELFVEYRLLATTDVDLDSFTSFTVPYRANNLFMGMRINY